MHTEWINNMFVSFEYLCDQSHLILSLLLFFFFRRNSAGRELKIFFSQHRLVKENPNTFDHSPLKEYLTTAR
jgi:hypothetical protein